MKNEEHPQKTNGFFKLTVGLKTKVLEEDVDMGLTSVWDALSEPARSIIYSLPHFTAPLTCALDLAVCLTFI